MIGVGRPRTCNCGECAKCKHREYVRGWYHKNRTTYLDPDRRRTYERVRYHTNDEFRMKKKARNMVGTRLARGTMTRGACVLCGRENAQAHHYGYTRPLDVTWLCGEHHGIIHAVLPED